MKYVVVLVAVMALRWGAGSATAVDYPPPSGKPSAALLEFERYISLNTGWLNELLRGRVCCTRIPL
jgi:hypothetical protein